MTHIEAMKQWAEDVSKAYDVLAFGNSERALEILSKTRTSLRQAITTEESSAVQKPVAWLDKFGNFTYNEHRGVNHLYTHPQPKADHIPDATKMVEQELVGYLTGEHYDGYPVFISVEKLKDYDIDTTGMTEVFKNAEPIIQSYHEQDKNCCNHDCNQGRDCHHRK